MLTVNEKFNISRCGKVPGTGFSYAWELGQDMLIRDSSGNIAGIGRISPYDAGKKSRVFTILFAEDSALTDDDKKVCKGLCKVFEGLDSAIMNAVTGGLYDIADNLTVTGLMPFTAYIKLNPDARCNLADMLTDYALKSVVMAMCEGLPEELNRLMNKNSVLWPLAESIMSNSLFREWKTQSVNTDRNLRLSGYGEKVE